MRYKQIDDIKDLFPEFNAQAYNNLSTLINCDNYRYTLAVLEEEYRIITNKREFQKEKEYLNYLSSICSNLLYKRQVNEN